MHADAPEQASGDVGGFAPGRRLAGRLQREARLPQVPPDDLVLQLRRIGRDGRLHLPQEALGVAEDTAVVDLPRVDVLVEAVRMARLVVAGGLSAGAPFNGSPDLANIAVEPVHRSAGHPQPATAVDPRPPSAYVSGEVGQTTVVEVSREPAQVFDDRWNVRKVVEAEVHVGVRTGLAAGPRATEHHGGTPGTSPSLSAISSARRMVRFNPPSPLARYH